MTTGTNNTGGSGSHGGGVGALLIEGRLSDLASSVHNPVLDPTLPRLDLEHWDLPAPALRSVIAGQSAVLALKTLKVNGNDERRRGFPRQATPDSYAVVEGIESVLQDVADEAVDTRALVKAAIDRESRVNALLDSVPPLATRNPDPAAHERQEHGRRNLVTVLDQSLVAFHRLKERFTSGVPHTVDLRTAWYAARDQRNSSGCVGFAVADTIWRQRGQALDIPSARFIWQGAKEMDGDSRPTTMVAGSGTSLRAALALVKEHGFAFESELSSDDTSYYRGSSDAFYRVIGPRHISGFVNLGCDAKSRIAWLSLGRPIVCALRVGRRFLEVSGKDALVSPDDLKSPDTFLHALVIAGYRVRGFEGDGKEVEAQVAAKLAMWSKSVERKTGAGGSRSEFDEFPVEFLVRNSAGPSWGDRGYAWIRQVDFVDHFIEEYGLLCDQSEWVEMTTPPWRYSHGK